MKFIKYYFFLVSLVLIILMDPFMEEIAYGGLISLIMLSIAASLCILVLSFQKQVFWTLVVVSFLIILFNFFLLLHPSEKSSILQYASLTILIFLYAFLLFYFLMTSGTLSIRDVSNAISIYLLIGIGFGFLYSFIEKVLPGSFVYQAQGTKDISGDMIYFSFITLTTAGFGDILAVHKLAKVVVMMEVVTGVLYIAIMIGRLVGIGSGKKQKQ